MSDPRPRSKARGNTIKRRPSQNQPRSENKPAINPIKKRIRDLNRLLEHKDTLPADVRLNYERELASCKYDVEHAERARNRSRMIQKYHMVRFFGKDPSHHQTSSAANNHTAERKRATKLLKRARAQLSQEATTEGRKVHEANVHAREVDLNYTLYYPLHMVYTSLYATAKQANKETEQTKDKHTIDDENARRDGTMWKVVEQAMASGRLQDLREGRLEGYRDQVQDTAAEKQSQAGNRNRPSSVVPKPRLAKDEGSRGDDDDKDGDGSGDGAGFFE